MTDPARPGPASPERPAASDESSASLDDADLNLPGLAISKEFRDALLFKRTVRSGPLPDPLLLQGLVDIYPDAAKVLFEEYHEQSAHRRELERISVTTGSALALRGQIIGGMLGGIGLIGSLVVASLGREWAASIIGTASLVSLVSVFVVGRDQQKKERVEKAAIREKINQGDPVEDIEQSGSPAKSPSKPPKPASKPKKSRPG